MPHEAVTLTASQELRLASQVVVGLVDVAAVGARVVLSLAPGAGCLVQEAALELEGLGAAGQGDGPAGGDAGGSGGKGAGAGAGAGAHGGELRPVLAAGGAAAAGAPAVLVRNVWGPGAAEGEPPQVSLLAVNAALPEGRQGEVAAALADLVASRQQEGQEGQGTGAVVVAAGMLLPPQLAGSGPKSAPLVYSHPMNCGDGGEPLPPSLRSLPRLPPATPVRGDGTLGALLHVLRAAGLQACCLAVQAHKPSASSPPDLPDALPACDALGAVLAAAVQGGVLSYDGAACRTLAATHRWFVPEAKAGSDVMYM